MATIGGYWLRSASLETEVDVHFSTHSAAKVVAHVLTWFKEKLQAEQFTLDIVRIKMVMQEC